MKTIIFLAVIIMASAILFVAKGIYQGLNLDRVFFPKREGNE